MEGSKIIHSKIMVDSEEKWKEEALKEKEKGNEWFKKGDYQKAIEHYSNAITFDDKNEVLFGNRAQCYINLNMYTEAEQDCTYALNLNDKFLKGYYRRGIVRKLQGNYKYAYYDFKSVLKIDPKNKSAQIELESIVDQLGLDGTNKPDGPELWRNSVENEPESRQSTSKNKTEAKQSTWKSKAEAMDVDGEDKERSYVVTLPKNMPSTSYQFYCDWRELKKERGNDLKQQYIMKIGANAFAKIFDLSIEPEVFTEILFVLDLCTDFEFVFSLLSNFTRTTRFGSLILFLSDPEKETLKKLFTKVVESGKYSEDDVKQISAKYCIR